LAVGSDPPGESAWVGIETQHVLRLLFWGAEDLEGGEGLLWYAVGRQGVGDRHWMVKGASEKMIQIFSET
jgi:hypothetical protein